VEMAQQLLRDKVNVEERPPITPERIKIVVANYFHISLDLLDAKRRNKEIVMPRQIAQYLCRELTDLSYPKIGEAFGGMNHTTILSSCEKIGQQLEEDSKLSMIVTELKKRLTD